ncbi:MAG: hypothetical protein JSV00_09130, partial [bacterium]
EALRDDQLPDGAYPDFAPSPFLLGEPSPGWMDAGIIVPHIIYTMYADVRLLRRHYISMKKYMTYLEGRSEGFLLEGPMEAYGDWNGLDRRTSKVVIATAFFAWDARLMSEMARAIGEEDDAVYYASLFEKVRRAFTEAYVSPQGRIRSDTQTVYALALSMGLLDEALAAAAASRLAELVVSDGWRLTTGYIGTRFILQALTDSGKPEMALRLLLNRGFPSWGFMLDNGATTLWEKWDAYAPGGGMPDPRNTSFNHYALGSVGDWLYAGLAGIQPAEPGFRAITIRPTVFAHGIQHVRAEYLSVRGVIVSGWTVAEQTLRMKISIPPNTSASLHLPADKAAGVREVGVGAQDGKGVALTWPEPGRVVVKVGSGDYEFETTLPEEILRKTIPREPDTNGAGKGREAPWL